MKKEKVFFIFKFLLLFVILVAIFITTYFVIQIFSILQVIHSSQDIQPSPPKVSRLDLISITDTIKNVLSNNQNKQNLHHPNDNIKLNKLDYQTISEHTLNNLYQRKIYLALTYKELNAFLSKIPITAHLGFMLHRLYIQKINNALSIYFHGSGWFLETLVINLEVRPLTKYRHNLTSNYNGSINKVGNDINLYQDLYKNSNNALYQNHNFNSVTDLYELGINTIKINNFIIDENNYKYIYTAFMFYFEKWLKTLFNKFDLKLEEFLKKVHVTYNTNNIVICIDKLILEKLSMIIK